MSEKQAIGILLCCNKEDVDQNIAVLKTLNPPQGWSVEIQIIAASCSYAGAYQQWMVQKPADIRLYLKGRLQMLHPNLLQQVLDVFRDYPKAGIWGLIGSELPLTGDYTQSRSRYGVHYYLKEDPEGNSSVGLSPDHRKVPILAQTVDILDSAFLVTRVDLPWDDGVGDWFFTAAQCCKMKDAGYQVIVPQQWNGAWAAFSSPSDYETAAESPQYGQDLPVFLGKYHPHCQPLVSILIPTYNQPVFFRDALESALAQDYGNIEVLVGDDSTDDRTERLIQPYLHEYPFLSYFRHGKPLGGHGRKNLDFLMDRAQGTYIQYLFHDDLLTPAKIRRMMEYYKRDLEQEIGLISSCRNLIDENCRIVTCTPWMSDHDLILPGEQVGRRMLTVQYNFLGEQTTVLLRKESLRLASKGKYRTGYFFDVLDPSMGDVSTFLQVLRNKECVFIKDPMSSFRRHPGQNTHVYDIHISACMDWIGFAVNAWLHDCYIHTGEELWQTLQHAARFLAVRPPDQPEPEEVMGKWEECRAIYSAINEDNKALAIHLLILYTLGHALDPDEIRSRCRFDACTGMWGKR